MARFTGNVENLFAPPAVADATGVADASGDGRPTASRVAIDGLRTSEDVRIGNCMVKYGTDDVAAANKDDDTAAAAAAAAVDGDDATVDGLANSWLYSWIIFEL